MTSIFVVESGQGNPPILKPEICGEATAEGSRGALRGYEGQRVRKDEHETWETLEAG